MWEQGDNIILLLLLDKLCIMWGWFRSNVDNAPTTTTTLLVLPDSTIKQHVFSVRSFVLRRRSNADATGETTAAVTVYHPVVPFNSCSLNIYVFLGYTLFGLSSFIPYGCYCWSFCSPKMNNHNLIYGQLDMRKLPTHSPVVSLGECCLMLLVFALVILQRRRYRSSVDYNQAELPIGGGGVAGGGG